MRHILSSIMFLLVFSSALFAEGGVPEIDTGDTAWMIVASALVLLMTPGLALFYGGMVRRKNMLEVLMKTMSAMAVMSIMWVLWGYSLAFAPGNAFIGGFDYIALKGVGLAPLEGSTIPHQLFMVFQGMFAIITPALIIGAFVERMKFSGYLLFILLWGTFVYAPVCHWVWGGGWLGEMGALDFAGGTVVHINAGIAALVVAFLIGRRKGAGHTPTPHNLPMTVLGAALLWFGWFGFNAGSQLAADGTAVNAFVVTNIAASAGALGWILMDRIITGRPTMLGFVTGVVAGLVAITPASGFVDVTGAIIIGLASAVICYTAVAVIKPKLGYDDSLDAFGVHGIGGIVGALLTGVFALEAIGGTKGLIEGNASVMWPQFVSVAATIVYSLVVTIIIYKAVDLLIGMRIDDKTEAIGIDLAEHNERAYTLVD
ncbi:MAG: ammonium transporter [Candidatus Goldiibacteriota bacterium]